MTTDCLSEDKYVEFGNLIQALIGAQDADQEEMAISHILRAAHDDITINYGYRVHSLSEKKLVEFPNVHEHLDEELMVTIFMGDQVPYKEYIWHPKDNMLITRLLVP